MKDKYEAIMIRRDGMGQTKDDFHATVTRISDGKQLVIIRDWRWRMHMALRRKPLDRAFKRMDRRDRKLAEGKRFRL